jgi:ABC-type nitrate/sulfonate/bicarbonate transport system substrate-binding protein
LYVAQDQGYFRKYGLDLTLVQVRNGPVGMSALSSGESLLHWGSVSAANLGAIAEGADLVFVAGFINRLTGTFAVNPAIHNPAELKGKSLGVNSLSGGTWIFTMLTLDHWGLSPARDKIQMRALGDNSVVSQALLAGNVDAAYLSYTYAKIVQNKGFRVLLGSGKIADRFPGYRGHHTTKHDHLVGPDDRKRHQSSARWRGFHSDCGKQAAGRQELGQRTPS